MKFFEYLLWKFAPRWYWHRVGPWTVEEAATDFIQNYLPPAAPEFLSEKPEFLLENAVPNEKSGATLAALRRISAIYGVASTYADPTGRPAQEGWNKALLKDCHAETPDKAVEVIYFEVLRQLKEAKRI